MKFTYHGRRPKIISLVHYSLFIRGPVIIYRLLGGGGGGIFGRITWVLGERKGESVVTENPKGGSLKTLEGFRGGTTQICLENEGMEEEGMAKIIKCY